MPALALTFALNLLGILQPKFTQYAIDWHILPKSADGLMLLVGLFAGVQLLRLVFSYFQAVLLNTVGQYVMIPALKQVIAAGNSAYENLSKATKQATEMAEANVAAATETVKGFAEKTRKAA